MKLRNERRLLCALVGLLLSAPAARAHPMAIIPGALNITEREVRIDVQATHADLEHLRLDPDDVASVSQFAHIVVGSLALVDDAGRRLAPLEPTVAPTAVEGAAGEIHLRFPLHAPLKALSVRLIPGSLMSLSGALLQLEAAGAAVSLRLTPDGTPATIRPPWIKAPSDPVGAWVWDHRFDHLLALIGNDGSGAHLDVIAPAPLVAFWLPISRAAPDRLAGEEAAPALNAFARIVNDNVSVRSGGHPMRLVIERVGLLAPNDAAVHSVGAALDPIAYWSACVVVRLRAEGEVVDDSIEVRWSLFNAAIRRIHCKSEIPPAFLEREITPYAPVASWRLVHAARAQPER